MSRLARKYNEASFFHVIKERYINEYLKLLKKYADELNIEIIAYCIMGNHTHCLLKVIKIEDMSKLMQKVNTMYARYYNYMENKRVGYVFRDRFVSEPVTSNRYFIQCIKYIHMNPVKAGIVKEPQDYKFSSYRFYEKKKKEYNKNDFFSYEDYIEICNNKESKFNFFDINVEKNEELIYNAISRFLKEKEMRLYEIFESRNILKQLIIYLKKEEKIKYIETRKILEITRGTMEGLKSSKK